MPRFWYVLGSLALLAAVSARGAQGGAPAPEPGRRPPVAAVDAPLGAELSPEEAVRMASAGGKYRKLLAVLRVPGDVGAYGRFNDYGASNTPAWGGYSGLPYGYWVYVYPCWYIWGDAEGRDSGPGGEKRNWGPEQAAGVPDTGTAGDLPTAWASATPDEQDEWLEVEVDQAVHPVAVILHETFNPGALRRVTLFRPDTEEVDGWKGMDPTPPGKEKGVSIVPLETAFPTAKVRLYLASKEVPGWTRSTRWGWSTRWVSPTGPPASVPAQLTLSGETHAVRPRHPVHHTPA